MIFSFLFIYIFVVNIVYYVVHIVCEVDVIANSLVLYLPFCSTLNTNFFFFFFIISADIMPQRLGKIITMVVSDTYEL